MNPTRREVSSFREWRRKQAYNLLPLFPPIGKFLIRGFGATLRTQFTGYLPALELIESGKPLVFVFFHGRQFLLVHQLQGRSAAIMTSISYMGEIQSRILRSFGFTTIKGSSTRGAVRVLVEMIGHVRKGSVAVFAVDGPGGPYRKVKPGAVYVAKKLGLPVLPVSTSAWPSVVFDSVWDRYLLPLPFSKCAVHFGKPLILDSDLSDESVAKACTRLEGILTDLDEEADIIVGRNRK